MCVKRYRALATRIFVNRQQSAIDRSSPAQRLVFKRQTTAVAAQPLRYDICGAHKAGDKWRDRLIINLLWSADLGEMPGIEYYDAVGHDHRFLVIVRDVHCRDAEPLLQCLDLVPHVLADAGI